MSHGLVKLGCVILCLVMMCTLGSCGLLQETSDLEQITTTTKATTTKRAPLTTTTALPPTQSGDTILSVPVIAQFPEFPTGCESVSAVMALRYYGETISVTEFVNTHLS